MDLGRELVKIQRFYANQLRYEPTVLSGSLAHGCEHMFYVGLHLHSDGHGGVVPELQHFGIGRSGSRRVRKAAVVSLQDAQIVAQPRLTTPQTALEDAYRRLFNRDVDTAPVAVFVYGKSGSQPVALLWTTILTPDVALAVMQGLLR